jgi:hypothetical protein
MSDPADTAERQSPLIHPRPAGDLPGRDGGERPWLKWVLRIGPLVLLALFLAPARDDALRGDDEWSFQFRGVMLMHHFSLWHQIWADTKTGLSAGRPEFLGAIISDPVLDLFDAHPAEYHIYLIALTVLCGALLWSLVRALTDSERLAALVVVMFAGALQLHFYHDALLGYYGGTQVAVALLLASLLTFFRSVDAERRWWAWTLATGVLFGAACAIEQWMDLLVAVHLCLGLVEVRGRHTFRIALPIIAVALAFFIAGALGSPLQQSTGYSAALNVGNYLYAFARSLVPPIPTSNRLFSQGMVTDWYDVFPLGGSPTAAEWLAALWRGAVVCGVTLGFCLWPGRRRLRAPTVPRAAMRLIAVGVPLWLVAPLLVVIAVKYQVDITLTRGYIESFAQTIGVVLIVVAALLWGLERARRLGAGAGLIVGGVAAALFGVAAGVDGFNNIRIVALEQPVRRTRDLLEGAAKNGVLDTIPQRATLLLSGIDMNWYTGNWAYVPGSAESILYADTRRLYDVRPEADIQPLNCPAGAVLAFPPVPCAPPLPSSWWVRVRATLNGGTVIAARISHPTEKSYLNALATRLVVYTEQSGSRNPSPPLLEGLRADGSLWTSGGLHFTRLRAAGDWAIYTATVPAGNAPKAQSLTDPRSVVNFVQLAPPDQLSREFGTKQLLP